ncbi:MAG: VWA domain-containing protein [Acidiferrobacteraceae bacterium]|nr:VWA domain-containing protein [Acidiferrobacteraceae bacterium]MBT3770717.1 VWA domain-containing protein [Acidiferrobacteraceae bacterium]MBT3973317.1 VWA domain-containing protein [Acidiferrobacteraceae bacterium]MBT4404043.1 VWA domain-containing protein [Acidiferrobacteraceae bacterium]MBT4806037.1 VWA domain-containing protein [Acidiferrobacteraceae bacterium]
MLINFFQTLKNTGIAVSVKEYLVLLEAVKAGLAFASVDDFYLLARTCLVKDEKYFDRFDRAFSAWFKDLETVDDIINALVPEDWLRAQLEKHLSDEEKAKIQSLGSLEKLLEEFRKRLKEQEKRHSGGSKWIGTGGTSPFGNSGYHPEGIRVGGQSRNRSAVKVWEERHYQNLDDSLALGTRSIKMALRRLRKFARTGAEEELDLDDTIRCTARNAGFLDIKMVPERHNAVKVLVFFDVGGSMYPYVRTCEELFSAARSEFKHLDYFYFHNFFYDFVWRDNQRRRNETTRTWDVLHTYPQDYKVIIVGDASMAPYEIVSVGGSVEYMNRESGVTWITRLQESFDKVIWFNPTPKAHWGYTQSIGLIQELVEDHMYPLTLDGLDRGIRYLAS